jgi:hypothetical protein
VKWAFIVKEVKVLRSPQNQVGYVIFSGIKRTVTVISKQKINIFTKEIKLNVAFHEILIGILHSWRRANIIHILPYTA